MNMPVLTATHSSPPPADQAARAADAGTTQDETPAFSNVLSQQRSSATNEPAPPASGRAVARSVETDKKQDPLGPDEALALILDSTALPLMQAAIQTPHTALRHQAAPTEPKKTAISIAEQTTHQRGHAAVTVLANAAASDDAQASKSLPGDAAQRSSRVPAEPSTLTPSAQPQAKDIAVSHPRAAALSRPAAAALSAATDGIASPASPAGGAAPHQLPASLAGAPDAPATSAVGQTTSALGATLLPAADQPVIQLAVPTPLSSPQWPQDFSRQVLNLTKAGVAGHTVQMHVNPPELGPIRITLHLGESIAQATFISPHANVRQALENALPHLEQQLTQAGLSLGEANVSDQPGSQQQTGQSPQGPDSSDGAVTFSLDGGTATVVSTQTASPAPRPAIRPDALVDTFV